MLSHLESARSKAGWAPRLMSEPLTGRRRLSPHKHTLKWAKKPPSYTLINLKSNIWYLIISINSQPCFISYIQSLPIVKPIPSWEEPWMWPNDLAKVHQWYSHCCLLKGWKQMKKKKKKGFRVLLWLCNDLKPGRQKMQQLQHHLQQMLGQVSSSRAKMGLGIIIWEESLIEGVQPGSWTRATKS